MENCKKKKVLALGYLPKWRGGLQTSGLATGIFDLHNAVNIVSQNVEVVIAATDVFKEEIIVDNTRVIGWTKSLLIKHAFRYFYRLPFFLVRLLALVKYYPVVNPLRDFVKVLLLDYAVEREKPDFIHLHGVLYALFKPIIWERKIPVMLRIHGLNGQNTTYKNYKVFCKMEKMATHIPFRVVSFLTEENRRQWREYYGEFQCPMLCFSNGFDSSIFHAPNNSIAKDFDLITVGGVDENKGQWLIIQALSQAKKKGVNYRYLIVGDGEDIYMDKLKDYINLNELDVTFKHYCSQTELPELLWRSRFFILQSLTEGFGKVIIESIACGTPVIIPSHIPIVKQDSIINANNTILTERTVGSISDVLLCLDSYPLFNSSDVSKTVKGFAWQSIAKDYSRIYQ